MSLLTKNNFARKCSNAPMILLIVIILLTCKNSFSIDHKVMDFISNISYDTIETSAKGNEYVWIKGYNLSLLFKKSPQADKNDQIVTDEYEIKYVLKNYYMKKYSLTVDTILGYLLEFNKSRNPYEEQCKIMLGYTMAECKDYKSCYYACYYHPSCRFGLGKTINITSTIISGNETETKTEEVVLYGDANTTNDVVTASYYFSTNTRTLDAQLSDVIKRLSEYKSSYNFTFPREQDFQAILRTISSIEENALFQRAKLAYCKPIPYEKEYIRSAITVLSTIGDKKIDIDYFTAKTLSDTKYYLGIIESEKAEQNQKLFNITRKFDGAHQQGISMLDAAISRFRYAEYFNLKDTLTLSYQKLKSASRYEEAEVIANDYELSFNKINDTIKKGDDAIQKITLLRNSAVNTVLNAKKDNYDAKTITNAIETVDKILEKDAISDSDINYIVTTLDKVRTAPDVANSEELEFDSSQIILVVLSFGVLIAIVIGGVLVFKKAGKPIVTAIVRKKEDNTFETTIMARLEKDAQPLKDGTPVKFHIGKGTIVGESRVEDGVAHATLLFDDYPPDMDIKIEAEDIEVAIRVHFVLEGSEEQKKMEKKTKQEELGEKKGSLFGAIKLPKLEVGGPKLGKQKGPIDKLIEAFKKQPEKKKSEEPDKQLEKKVEAEMKKKLELELK